MKPDRRSQLIENYEDAIFALAMNDLMMDEGEYWEEENERLKSDKSFTLPEKMNQRCMRAIERTISRRERRRTGSAVWKVTARIAVAFMAVFIAFSFSFMTVSAVREPVLEFFINNYGNGAFVRVEPAIEDTGMDFGPKWVPATPLQRSIIADEENFHILRFDYEDGSYIKYKEQWLGDGVNLIDTEDVIFTKQDINDKTIMFAQKNGVITCRWAETKDETDWVCEMSVYGFDEKIVIRILDSFA